MPRPHGDLQLAMGYWIVSHKQALQRWWVIILMAAIGASMTWTVLFFTVFFQQRQSADAIVIDTAGRLGRLALGVHKPDDLVPGKATILQRDQGHVDLIARVDNPNSDWGAVQATYHWQVNGQAVATDSVFINPKTTRPVISLNVTVANLPTEALLVVDDVEWARVGSASLPPAIFVTDALTLTPTSITVGGQSVASVSLRATVTNRSVYNYYRVAVPVIVLAGDTIVAVDLLTHERWPTLTSRTIASSWSYPVTGASTAEILPQVSQFSMDNIYR